MDKSIFVVVVVVIRCALWSRLDQVPVHVVCNTEHARKHTHSIYNSIYICLFVQNALS